MSPPGYHHGDLPNELRHAAVDLIDERGLGAFSLREVARRAGVSHAAPAHHFGDLHGLLTSVATEAFEHLRARTAAAAARENDPIERLVAIGRAYVETGRAHPGHCAVVFRVDLVDTDDPGYVEAGQRAFAVLEDTVRAFAVVHQPELDVAEAAYLCWCAMQGLLVLDPKMREIDAAHGRPVVEPEARAERFTRLLIAGLRAR
jgi:AcrR family transcriptional regulator